MANEQQKAVPAASFFLMTLTKNKTKIDLPAHSSHLIWLWHSKHKVYMDSYASGWIISVCTLDTQGQVKPHTSSETTILLLHSRKPLPEGKAEGKMNASELGAKLMPVAIPHCPLLLPISDLKLLWWSSPSKTWPQHSSADPDRYTAMPHFKLWQANYWNSVNVIYFSKQMPQG